LGKFLAVIWCILAIICYAKNYTLENTPCPECPLNNISLVLIM